MGKLDLLVDGTTIINFPFIFKLFKRYLKSTLVIMFITTLFCVGLYFVQENFYYTAISFSSITEEKDVKNSALALLDTKSNIRATDILNLRSSVDFNRKIAGEIIASEFFYRLRFDLGMLGFKQVKANDINKKCSLDKDCLIEEVAKRIPKFYEITDKDRTGVNFNLEVKALDDLTANVILGSVVKAINDTRLEVVKLKIKDDIEKNTSMLIQKKNEINVEDFYKYQEDRDRLENDLKEVQTKIDHQINVMTVAQDNLAIAESNYEHSKKIASKKIDYDEVDLENRRKDLRDKIEKLNSDIAALENSTINQTDKDREIIAQLKKEYVEAKTKLKKLGNGNSNNTLSSFVKLNDEKFRAKELEFKVVKDQLDSAKKSYEELNIKKKDILNLKIKTEQNLEIIKPSIEFIKNLEIKIEQQKLLSSSVIPDIHFDRYSTTPEPMKKIGLILTVGYMIILNIMFVVMFLSLRFIIDGKIYDEDDLRFISKDLKVIGDGPEYK